MTPSDATKEGEPVSWSDAREVRMTLIGLQGFSYVQRAIEAFDRLVVDHEVALLARDAESAEREQAIKVTGETYDYWIAHYRERAEKAEAALLAARQVDEAMVERALYAFRDEQGVILSTFDRIRAALLAALTVEPEGER